MFVIVDPVNPSNNTARNSFRTPEVLKSFREAFKRLKKLIHQHYHEFNASGQQKLLSEPKADCQPRVGAGSRQGADSGPEESESSKGKEPERLKLVKEVKMEKEDSEAADVTAGE
jgi:hypothetical protein